MTNEVSHINDAKPKVWLDMDPGIDDAWGLVVALSSAEVMGVSAVAGNVPLPNTFGNIQRMLSVLGRSDLPALPGAEHPLLGPLITATAFHGATGMGHWEGQVADIPDDAVRVWRWWAENQRMLSTSHLIVTGPLTNVAIALLAEPQLGRQWKSVTCMCGALPGAQIDKAQEFNVYVDPHAADLVFHWAERVQLIGINVAHKALIPVQDIGRLRRYGKVGRMLREMLQFYTERSLGEGGDPGAFPVDDVVAVAGVVCPEIFQWREVPLAVVREGPLRGTVVLSPVDLRRPNVRVASDIDADAFRAWLWESMEHYLATRV